AGWDQTGVTEFTYTGSPDFVQIDLNMKVSIDNAQSVQRPNSVIEVVRVNDGKVVASSATGYIRDSSDHEESSYHISVIDATPTSNPTYKVTYIKESTNNGVVTVDPLKSSFSLIAWD
ncbi:MAG: hypothetical protein AAFU67_18550, partial [Bacteroidota bacterium]